MDRWDFKDVEKIECMGVLEGMMTQFLTNGLKQSSGGAWREFPIAMQKKIAINEKKRLDDEAKKERDLAAWRARQRNLRLQQKLKEHAKPVCYLGLLAAFVWYNC